MSRQFVSPLTALTAFHRHDFNDEMENGKAFSKVDDWHADTMVKWAKYSTEAFDSNREASVDNGEGTSRGTRRELLVDDGGLPLIPPMDGEDAPSLPMMKSMIRDFLSTHYRKS